MSIGETDMCRKDSQPSRLSATISSCRSQLLIQLMFSKSCVPELTGWVAYMFVTCFEFVTALHSVSTSKAEKYTHIFQTINFRIDKKRQPAANSNIKWPSDWNPFMILILHPYFRHGCKGRNPLTWSRITIRDLPHSVIIVVLNFQENLSIFDFWSKTRASYWFLKVPKVLQGTGMHWRDKEWLKINLLVNLCSLGVIGYTFWSYPYSSVSWKNTYCFSYWKKTKDNNCVAFFEYIFWKTHIVGPTP